MGKRKILVIEDDKPIRAGIVDALHFQGYDTLEAETGSVGLELALRVEYDLLLLDLILPGVEGLEILKQLRTSRPTMPVVILTARGEESDRIRGLRLGADDYVVKPFGIKELLARVEAVLRRSAERPADIEKIRLPGGVADLARGEVRFTEGRRCRLTEREVELLRYLACNAGRAVSREEILARVWRMDPRWVQTRTIDMHIARLREKLAGNADQPPTIITVRGKGYMFAAGKIAQ